MAIKRKFLGYKECKKPVTIEVKPTKNLNFKKLYIKVLLIIRHSGIQLNNF